MTGLNTGWNVPASACAAPTTAVLVADHKGATGSTNPRDHLYGHAAYTRLTNLLFNTTEIVQALYPAH